MRILLASLLLMTSVWVHAASLEAQREAFTPVLTAAERGNLYDQPEILESLQGYPLYNYLIAADLSHRLRRSSSPSLDREIENFVNQNPDLPPADRLRRRWIASLAARGQWRQVRDLTQDDEGRTTTQCLNFRAHLALDQTSGLASRAEKLWLVGSSQPDECDPVFEWMQTRGQLTPTLILERARLAVIDRNSGLANYLARKLDGSARDTVERWVALLGSPVDIKFTPALDPDVAVTVFKRFALQDIDAAANIQDGLRDRLRLGPEHIYEMRRYLGLLYAQNHEPEALAWFERLDEARMDDYARAWRIRAAIFHSRWALALNWINALPEAEAKDEIWRYWKARAQQQMGQQAQAEAAFQALAVERSYYGYLAADRVDVEYSFNSQPLVANTAVAQRLQSNPALARARELHYLDMNVPANREWLVLTSDLDQAGLQQAALLAHQWQWYSRAIITLAQGDYWDDLDIRYPIIYRDLVSQGASKNRLDPAYVMAIIRTESLFQPAVHSPANAVGLMQLLPATARNVAHDIGAARPSVNDLEEPAVNIPLGTRYLRDQLDRFSNNMALSSAAYNAGPHRVSRWLKQASHRVDADVWVENIPYTETREYVQRAMSHMTVFQARLGDGITRVSDRIAPITPDSES